MDLAQFGIVVNPPDEGVAKTVAGLRQMGSVAEETHRKVVSVSDASGGAFNRMAQDAVRTSSATTNLLRTLGPLGGAAMEMGVRLERAAVQGERLLAMTSASVSRQEVLTAAYRSGALAAATMESAEARVTQTRLAAAAAERTYQAALAASNTQTAAAREVSQAIAMQRISVKDAEARAANAALAMERAGIMEYDRSQRAVATATAAVSRERRVLAELERTGAVETIAAKNAALQLSASRQAQAVTAREAAAAETVLRNAEAGAAAGFGATTVIIAAIVATLLVLVTTIYAVKKAWDFLTESMAAASKVQSAQMSLRLLIGNATEAHRVFEELNQIELDTGVFDERSLLDTATRLYGVGIGVDDLTKKTRELANVAAVMNKPIDASTQAYVRLIETVGATGKIQARSLVQFAQQGFDVLLVLSETTGKTRDEIARMVKEGEIGIKDIDRALAEFAKKDFLGERAKTWEGLGKRVAAAWEEVHEAFGLPIIDALGPIMERLLTSTMPGLIRMAGEWGESIAHVIRAFDKIAKEQGWQTALLATWEWVILQMAKTAYDVLIDTFKALAPMIGRALWEAIKVSMTGGGAIDLAVMFASTFGKELNDRMMAAHGRMADALRATETTGVTRGVGAAADLSAPGLRRSSILPRGGDMRESDYDKLKTDLTAINEMWYQMSLIQAKVGDETEKNRRINELFAQTSKELYNPAQLERYVAQLEAQGVVNARLILQDAERVRKQHELDAAIKANTASLEQSMVSGIHKATEAWGSFDQMVEKSATDITNALANDISSGLTDILTGTKSVSDGFRDMAISIIKDIEAIIVKMLVQYALQQLLGGFTGGGSGGGSATYGGFRATGGPIYGGSGVEDDVHIMAMGGEFMMPKHVVESEGVEKMEALRRGQAKIVRRYADGGVVENFGGGVSHYGSNPRDPRSPVYNPPWHWDAYGGFADYEMWRSSLNTRFTGGIEGAPTYPPIGDVDIPPIGEDPTIMTPPVIRPEPSAPGGTAGNPPVLPTGPGQNLGGPSLFGDQSTQGRVGIPWWWNVNYGNVVSGRIPTSGVGPGNIIVGGSQTPAYNSTRGTWEYFDPSGELISIPGPAPIGFGGHTDVASGNFIPDPTRGYVDFIDPATGLPVPASVAIASGGVPGLQNWVGTIPTGTNYGPGSQFGGFTTPSGMHVVGFDTVTGAPVYADASGRNYVNPGTGTPVTAGLNYSNFGGVTSGQRSTLGNAAFDSHAAGLMQMAFQSYGGNPNNMGTTTDAGHTIFYNNNVIAHASEGVVTWEQRTPENTPPAPPHINWVFPSQAESARLGLSYSDPIHVKAHNDWLASHNQANYAILAAWRMNVLAPWQAAHSSPPPLSITTQGGQPPIGPMGPDPALIAPGGGGRDGGLIQAFVAMGAERMHSGGTVGGSGDEVPIIAKRGERIVTQEQWSAIAGAGRSQNVQQTNSSQVIVEVHYHGDTGATDTKSRSRGGDAIDAEALAKAIEPVVNRFMLKQKRAGGINAAR